MNRKWTIGIVAALLCVSVCVAGSYFTDITSHYAPSMVTQANTALDALEDEIIAGVDAGSEHDLVHPGEIAERCEAFRELRLQEGAAVEGHEAV